MNEKKNSLKLQNQLTVELIRQIQENIYKGNSKDNIQNKIKCKIPIVNKKLESFYQKIKNKKYFIAKFQKFFNLSLNTKKRMKNSDDNTRNEFIETSLVYLSIYILKNFIINKRHNNIKEYLKVLLFFIYSDVLKIEQFFFLLDLLLKSIVHILSNNNSYQTYRIDDEPLLFINDIIKTIINYPLDMTKNIKFIKEIIDLFNNFFKLAQKLNIFIIKDNIWLKLFENKKIDENIIKIYEDENNNHFEDINNFLIKIYRKQVPEYFYNEIFKNSAIDLPYYLNIIKFLKKLYKEENNFQKDNGFKIKNGICILGNTLIKENISFNNNEFSLFLSFKIIKMKKGEEISVFNLIKKDKTNIIKVLINKDKNLVIENNDDEWNTKILINENKFYLLCIMSNSKSKNMFLFINTDLVVNLNASGNKTYFTDCCYIYSRRISYPKYNENMDILLGSKNFCGILGDIILINKELKENIIENIFDSNEYYGNLIYRNNICNINNSLIKDRFLFSENSKKSIEIFRILKYDVIFRINSSSFFSNIKLDRTINIFEYKNVYSCIKFYEEKGFEFLIFMLHNINSQIKNNKLFNIYLYKTIDFLYNIIINYKEITEKVLSNSNGEYDSYIEVKEKDIIKRVDIFFLSLLNILKGGQKNDNINKRKLSSNVRNSLISFLSLKINTSSYFKNIIISLIFDVELFDQKKYISELNTIIIDKLDISMLNKDIIYKIFFLDFIFELKNIKHKKLCDFISFIIINNNKLFCTELINYISYLEKEVKIYHYLKIIYFFIKDFKKQLNAEEIFKLYTFLQKKFDTLNYEHCKYCSYIIILCYLIKDQIWDTNDDNNLYSFKYSSIGYMISPSFIFIRCVFIQNFNLNNYDKLKFIKSKDNVLYNLDFFDSIKKNPCDLIKYNQIISIINELVKYFNFLFELKNKKLNNLFDNFFPFVIQFLEKIKKTSVNKTNKKIVIKYVSDLLSSEEIGRFFILFLQYNKDKSLKIIREYIKTSLLNVLNPFYFYIISPKTQIGNQEDTEKIKIEIIKYVILEMLEIKKFKKNCDNIYYLLILIYQNTVEEKISITKDFPPIFNSYFAYPEREFYLDKRPINLDIFNKKESENIENVISSNKNIKFILELILEILFNFCFVGKFEIKQIIYTLLIKERSSSIFYFNDLKIKITKNKTEEQKESIIMNELDNLIFTLYFLIYFCEKRTLCKKKEQETLIVKIMSILSKDLKELYRKNNKTFTKLKKIEIEDEKFDIYNKMLEICNKKYKEMQFDFNYKFFYNKYCEFTKKKISKEIEDKGHLFIENMDKIDFDDDDNKFKHYKYKKIEIKRSNSSENKISNSLKERYMKNNEEEEIQILLNNFDNNNNILNKTMVNPYPNNYTNKMIQNYDDEDGENYLRAELSKINIIGFYYKNILNNFNLNSNSIIKMLFNPKEYFLWKNFTIIFKDFLYYNKKFKKLGKAFLMHTRSIKVAYSSNKEKNYYLNYPTKIKNYITDDYYRPFLKPYLNFFSHKYIKQSHNFMKETLLKNPQFKEDKFNIIKFKRILPDFNIRTKIICEKIQNKGNIFGYLAFYNDLVLFINSPEEDKRNSDDLNKCLEYIYCLKEDAIIDDNKYTILYYRDIKEIIKRRVCLNYVGYEIFMKDNHSYLFNFFNNNACNSFLVEIKKYSSNLEENKKIEKIQSNGINITKKNMDLSLSPKKENDYIIIEEPYSIFEKMQYKKKYEDGEISNLNYLFLLNKYSSRSYNDYNQYLIFPLLILDSKGSKKRNLSFPICLNKEDNQASFKKAINNKNIVGYYFNQHYSTGGYILFYLVRLIPFTYCQIEFQSGKFDLPARLFSSFKNYLCFLSLTQDNRELCPEFYFNYELFLNLNYNDFGIMESENEYYYLNNVDNERKETCIQFVIYLRKLLEKSDVSSWIDNIFGINQLNDSDERPNSFPFYTYESYCEFEKIKKESKPLKKRVKEIRTQIELLKFGITPAKVINKPQKDKKFPSDHNDYITAFNKRETKIIEIINDYIRKKSNEKFYFINSYNENEIELTLKFKSRIDIFKLKIGENKHNEITLITKGQIDMEPYNNLFCEIITGVYCIVRNEDNTLQFISIKKIISIYQWTCIITAIESFIQKKKIEEKNIKKVFIGDENGYLHLIKIEYEFIEKEKAYEIKSVSLLKSVKAHRSLIKGIIYNERLNIIISWSNEGIISINNDYSFNFLNIIDLGDNYDIREILISKYDLLCINCYKRDNKEYKTFCYTLNGIQVTNSEVTKKIIRLFADEKLNVVYDNGNIFSYNYSDLDTPKNSIYSEYINKNDDEKLSIKYSMYYPKFRKLLMIYNNNKISFQNISKGFI